MQEGAISITNIQEAQTSTPIYSIVSSQNYNFRILTSQFHRNTLLIFYNCFLWLGVAFSAAILILCHSLHLKPYPFLVTLAVALMPLNVLAVYNRQIYGKNMVFSSILLNLIVITLAILLSLGIPNSGIAFGVYLFFETTCNCLMMQNKGKILLKLLMLVQLLMICLKIDQTITLEWDQTLFGLIIIFLFLVVVAVSIFAYSIFISTCLHQNCYEIKQLGLRFLALNILSVSSLMAIPIWTVFINEDYHIPTMATLTCLFFTIVFSFFKRTEIAIFLCESLQIANKDEPKFMLINKQTDGLPHLFQVSQNWFVDKYDQSTCEKDLELEQCVACMVNKAETVWQPCGHCVLCNQCMRQLLNTKCPLCKAIPQQIVRVSKRSDLSDVIMMRKNQFQIVQCIAVQNQDYHLNIT